MLAVDDIPVRSEEIESVARDVALLYPAYTESHCRRLALTNAILPRAAARARHPEAWERAREAARSAQPEALAPSLLEGPWRMLGLELWHAARTSEPGRWSEPIELSGRFVLLRLEAPPSGTDPREEVLRLSLLEFPYVDPAAPAEELASAVDASRLTIIDPVWGELVPESWKHRMRESSP